MPASPPSPRSPSLKKGESLQRKASLWFLLAILQFLIGFLWLAIVFRTTGLWLSRQHYLPAELEVQAVSYDAGGGTGRGGSSSGSGRGAEMEGVITPGRERVWVDMSGFNVMIFDGKYDASGRLPMLEEIRGQAPARLVSATARGRTHLLEAGTHARFVEE